MLRKDTKIELLKRVPLFAGCSKAELGKIASIADEIDLSAGKVMIREGEIGRQFYVLIEGSVDVTQKGRSFRFAAAVSSSARSRCCRTLRPPRRSPRAPPSTRS